MKKSDYDFQKSCQSYAQQINKLFKAGEQEKADELKEYINKSLLEWEEQLRSARFKINMLRFLLASVKK